MGRTAKPERPHGSEARVKDLTRSKITDVEIGIQIRDGERTEGKTQSRRSKTHFAGEIKKLVDYVKTLRK